MNDYELTVKINWSFEDYFYSNDFSLERIGYYRSSIFLSQEELPNPEYLYKFYGNSKYTLQSLKNQSLFFSSPREFNDPFDCITNREEYIRKGGQGIINHRDNIGVCCFTLIKANPLMWGHYTNNYRGICIKFRNQNLLKSDHIDIKSHVSYLKNYEPSNHELNQRVSEFENLDIPTSDKDFIKKVLVMLFEYCWKYYDWKYEKEYRAISFNSRDFERKLSFQIDDIQEIYIGNRLKDADTIFYNSLVSILKKKYPHVKVFQVKPNPLVVKLEFEEINI